MDTENFPVYTRQDYSPKTNGRQNYRQLKGKKRNVSNICVSFKKLRQPLQPVMRFPYFCCVWQTSSVSFTLILNPHLRRQSHTGTLYVCKHEYLYISLSHTQTHKHTLLFRSEMRWKSNCVARRVPAAISGMNTTIPLQTPFNVAMARLTCNAVPSFHFFLEGAGLINSAGDFVRPDSWKRGQTAISQYVFLMRRHEKKEEEEEKKHSFVASPNWVYLCVRH